MNILSLLSELSQVQKNKYLYFPFIQNLDPQSSHEIRSPSVGRAGSLWDGGEGLRESREVVDMIKVHSVPVRKLHNESHYFLQSINANKIGYKKHKKEIPFMRQKQF